MGRQWWVMLVLALALAACAPDQLEQQAPPVAAATVVTEADGEATAERAKQVSGADTTDEATLVPKDCPVTLGQATPFVPPEAYPAKAPWGEGWYGSEALWTSLPPDGIWRGLPWNGHGYTQKVLWWREGYRWNEEPEPALTVTGRRLNGPAPPLESLPATNAFAQDIRSAMLVGVSVPTAGCWEVTGRYGEAELSFVVWVTPSPY